MIIGYSNGAVVTIYCWKASGNGFRSGSVLCLWDLSHLADVYQSYVPSVTSAKTSTNSFQINNDNHRTINQIMLDIIIIITAILIIMGRFLCIGRVPPWSSW